MIIFFNKKTGDIYGLVSGRVHSEQEQQTLLIKPANVNKKDIGRFIAPFVPVFETVTEPITEFRLVDEKTKKVELVEIGKRKVKKAVSLKSTGKFSPLIDKFEKDSSEIFKYKAKINKNGELDDLLIKEK